MSLKIAREAILSEIESLKSQQKRLEAAITSLDSGTAAKSSKANGRGKTATAAKTKRLRMDFDTRASITDKILKAAKAHGKGGASKADILKYLNTSGYSLGHHFSEIHLFAILNELRDGDEPKITTTGAKAKMRYHAG